MERFLVIMVLIKVLHHGSRFLTNPNEMIKEELQKEQFLLEEKIKYTVKVSKNYKENEELINKISEELKKLIAQKEAIENTLKKLGEIEKENSDLKETENSKYNFETDINIVSSVPKNSLMSIQGKMFGVSGDDYSKLSLDDAVKKFVEENPGMKTVDYEDLLYYLKKGASTDGVVSVPSQLHVKVGKETHIINASHKNSLNRGIDRLGKSKAITRDSI